MSYKELKTYRQAIVIHDYTYEFCKKYIKKFSRTVDQMEQAARSGKQNIVEGTAVSKTSPSTELKLLGVARGSFEELLEDYKDFLREKNLETWDKDDARAVEVRKLAYGINRSDRTDKPYTTYKSYKTYAAYEHFLNDPEKAANAMIVLINQTNYLLDRQMNAVRAQMDGKGISMISQQQKVRMILGERQKNEKDFDEFLKGILKKSKSG